MDCKEFDEISLELLYDELDDVESAAARRHLATCGRCQALFAAQQALHAELDFPEHSPPPQLRAAILAAERQITSSPRFRQRLGNTISRLASYAMQPQLVMACVLLIMIGASLLFVDDMGDNKQRVTVAHESTPRGSSSTTSGSSVLRVYSDESEENRAQAPDELPSRHAQPSRQAETAPAKAARSNSPAEFVSSAAERYREAMTAYQEGNYSRSERLFQQLAREKGEKSGSAALHYAHSVRNGSGCERAAPIYAALGKSHAASSIGSEASWQAASCFRALGRNDAAVGLYRQLLEQSAYRSRAERAIAGIETVNSSPSDRGKPSTPADPASPRAVKAKGSSQALGGEKRTKSAGPSSTASKPLNPSEKRAVSPQSTPGRPSAAPAKGKAKQAPQP
ncbi:MAG: hypothetical protein MK135_05985 [Polyangiaceae bacterium]|nr:hypothetical protein [Polyangiaceae bacterium]